MSSLLADTLVGWSDFTPYSRVVGITYLPMFEFCVKLLSHCLGHGSKFLANVTYFLDCFCDMYETCYAMF